MNTWIDTSEFARASDALLSASQLVSGLDDALIAYPCKLSPDGLISGLERAILTLGVALAAAQEAQNITVA